MCCPSAAQGISSSTSNTVSPQKGFDENQGIEPWNYPPAYHGNPHTFIFRGPGLYKYMHYPYMLRAKIKTQRFSMFFFFSGSKDMHSKPKDWCSCFLVTKHKKPSTNPIENGTDPKLLFTMPAVEVAWRTSRTWDLQVSNLNKQSVLSGWNNPCKQKNKKTTWNRPSK